MDTRSYPRHMIWCPGGGHDRRMGAAAPEPRDSGALTPIVKGLPASSASVKCQRITSSVTGRNCRLGQTAHLISGFSHTPGRHSLALAGA